MKSYFTVFCFLMLFLTAIFTTSFAQINWTKNPNPVLIPGSPGTWSDYSLWPSCILYDGSTYHKWYGGYDEIYARIGYATSPDGITWTEYAGNPVLDVGPAGSWNDESVEVPYVLFDGSTYHMWYSGYDGTNSSIGYATSTDGITWTPYAGNPIMVKGPAGSWAETSIWSPCVRFDGSTYHMWFTGWNASAFICIGYATSADGMIWTEYADNPVLIPDVGNWDKQRVEVPDVLFDGSVYHMWFTGGNTTSWWEWRIGYATSSDGIQWTKYAGNPVLNVGAAGSWDDQWVGFARVLLDTTTSEYKMWYGGGDGLWNAKFGYATAPLIMNVPDNFETIQAAIDAAQDGSVVLVDEGTYYENINFKGKAITVASHFYFDGDTSHISNTIIDGSQPANPDSGSVVYFVSGEDTNSVLSGFTITSGSGTKRYFESDVEWYGGGIYCASGGRIMNNIVRDNGFDVDVLYAAGGGISAGLWGMWGTEYVIIHDNTIVSNSIMGNSECDGGGIAFFRNGRITDNIINENSLTSDVNWGSGGGIAVGSLSENPNIVVDGNQIISNKITGIDGAYGGGIIIGYCDVPITNNIISGNIASLGGGICLNTSNSEIINNTIVNNTASYQGGGLYSTDSNPVVVNTIFWDNEATNGSQIYGSGDVLYSDIQGGWSGEGNINADPLFLDTLSYNLSDLSPCVGTGIDSVQIAGTWYYCPATDISGRQRPDDVDLLVDMGAHESIFPNGIIDEYSDFLPTSFSLKQNYPNPFNPSTVISYQLPVISDVEVSIFNLLGQKVVTLVSEKQNAGQHRVQWNASGFASGIYYYSLKAGEFQQVRKMVLLK